jgi:ketol-acid reductoisomerase
MTPELEGDEAGLARLRACRIAVIGYGAQGRAHALNLRDSGMTVRVGLAADSASRALARTDGFTVGTAAEAAAWGEVIVLLAPDAAQPEIYRAEIAPHLAAGKLLLFAHGYAVHFQLITPPADVDVALVAPKGPGAQVRAAYLAGGGVPALFAVQQDASGRARTLALAYAAALGAARAGVLAASFAEECETDLFGEQVVLCGGAVELVKAAFTTLVEAGYQPEVAYLECLHELKFVVDLMHRGGLGLMRDSISDTAEWGGFAAGPRVIGPEARAAMRDVLADIRSGAFAREWQDEVRRGQPRLAERRAEERAHAIEAAGTRVRARMESAGAQPAVQEPVDQPGPGAVARERRSTG